MKLRHAGGQRVNQEKEASRSNYPRSVLISCNAARRRERDAHLRARPVNHPGKIRDFDAIYQAIPDKQVLFDGTAV